MPLSAPFPAPPVPSAVWSPLWLGSFEMSIASIISVLNSGAGVSFCVGTLTIGLGALTVFGWVTGCTLACALGFGAAAGLGRSIRRTTVGGGSGGRPATLANRTRSSRTMWMSAMTIRMIARGPSRSRHDAREEGKATATIVARA